MSINDKPAKQRIDYAPAENLAKNLYEGHLQNRTPDNWLDSNLILQIEQIEIPCPYCDEAFKFEIPTKHLKEHRKKAWIVRDEGYWLTVADPFWWILCDLYGIRLQDVMYTEFDPDNECLRPDDYVVQQKLLDQRQFSC